ncbi:hypothetical protein A0H76_647 [Hepatospora eriocheir]|uniref:Uncharacterized protein n=1 Tax=Hepatospora eriocheir TaxID=1081669 RepID=A0A1X0Q7I4_9MICR|nr:hypothetical protein A0H76_647 [Hepatospora eriocheir]
MKNKKEKRNCLNKHLCGLRKTIKSFFYWLTCMVKIKKEYYKTFLIRKMHLDIMTFSLKDLKNLKILIELKML